jgi:hypothetical protein
MTPLAGLGRIPRHLHARIVEQGFQAPAPVFAQRLPEFFLQASHHRRSRNGQLLLGPVQEAGGFPELLLPGGDLRFFLASGMCPAIKVICSDTSANSSANCWKRL